MAHQKIKIMISSRCKDHFPAQGVSGSKLLSTIRERLKKAIESEKLFDEKIFEVWICEDEPAESANTNSKEFCIKKVTEADLVLILYNGNAGNSSSE